jgi:hypothetical protein
MKIAVIGSRDFEDLGLVKRYVLEELPDDAMVVTGGARGVDQATEEAAEARGLEVLVLEPDWEGLGKRAGLLRNEDIVEEAELVVAFWDERSKGTVHALKLAVEAEKPVRVFGPDGREIEEGPWSQ